MAGVRQLGYAEKKANMRQVAQIALCSVVICIFAMVFSVIVLLDVYVCLYMWLYAYVCAFCMYALF